ncbi:Vesicle-associated protein 1-2 [Glycine soja]|uniref:Vesicle-associated protein 1-2 n=1 Tax=Glycine soja TaxID=3848 RepID=A0A445M2Y8_GLYSO|nr:Vesicle-associated protein 1-2 [Glycine soja]
MSSGELLHIQPQELQFPFELRKQISCSLQLSNKTDNYVAFKVKTTNPKKYCVRPNTGVVMPRSTCDVIGFFFSLYISIFPPSFTQKHTCMQRESIFYLICVLFIYLVTMQAQKEAPPDMQCKDKFLLQSVVASPGATTKDITPEMFNKESGHDVEECKLRVVYVAPPQPPSPVREGSDEDSSPRASVSENGHSSAAEFTGASKAFNERAEHQDASFEARAHISKVTEERNSVVEQNRRLQQELELLRRDASRSHGGVPFMYVVLVGIIGLILGFLLKRT